MSRQHRHGRGRGRKRRSNAAGVIGKIQRAQQRDSTNETSNNGTRK